MAILLVVATYLYPRRDFSSYLATHPSSSGWSEKVDTKFKFSQNRSKADRDGVIEGLAGRSDDLSKAVREVMIKNEAGRNGK